MSAVAELTDALLAAGMLVGDAAKLIARVAVEMTSTSPTKAALRTRKWREKRASQTVTERHRVTPANPVSEPSRNVTERHKPSPRDGAHISKLTSSNPIEESPKKEKQIEAPRSKKASRIPDDWQLEQRHIDYALSKGVASERIQVLGEKFKTYSLAASGKGAVSPDWFRKWCTWVLNEIEWNGATNGKRPHHARRQSGADDFFAGLASVAADIDGHRDVAGPGDADVPLGRFNIDAEPAGRG